eukprot:tig00000737_g3806.t1
MRAFASPLADPDLLAAMSEGDLESARSVRWHLCSAYAQWAEGLRLVTEGPATCSRGFERLVDAISTSFSICNFLQTDKLERTLEATRAYPIEFNSMTAVNVAIVWLYLQSHLWNTYMALDLATPRSTGLLDRRWMSLYMDLSTQKTRKDAENMLLKESRAPYNVFPAEARVREPGEVVAELAAHVFPAEHARQLHRARARAEGLVERGEWRSALSLLADEYLPLYGGVSIILLRSRVLEALGERERCLRACQRALDLCAAALPDAIDTAAKAAAEERLRRVSGAEGGPAAVERVLAELAIDPEAPAPAPAPAASAVKARRGRKKTKKAAERDRPPAAAGSAAGRAPAPGRGPSESDEEEDDSNEDGGGQGPALPRGSRLVELGAGGGGGGGGAGGVGVEEEALYGIGECCVCLALAADARLLPCRCEPVCESCAAGLLALRKTCPACTNAFSSFQRVRPRQEARGDPGAACAGRCGPGACAEVLFLPCGCLDLCRACIRALAGPGPGPPRLAECPSCGAPASYHGPAYHN